MGFEKRSVSSEVITISQIVLLSAGLLFSKQIAALCRNKGAKDTRVLNEAKRNEKRVDFDRKACGITFEACRRAGIDAVSTLQLKPIRITDVEVNNKC